MSNETAIVVKAPASPSITNEAQEDAAIRLVNEIAQDAMRAIRCIAMGGISLEQSLALPVIHGDESSTWTGEKAKMDNKPFVVPSTYTENKEVPVLQLGSGESPKTSTAALMMEKDDTAVRMQIEKLLAKP
jgi:hypothetical protein